MGELTELDMQFQIGMRQGYFDEETLAGFIELMETRLAKGDDDNRLRKAFRLYESTLAPNEEEVVAAFMDAVKKGVKNIATPSLNAVVLALKNLDRNVEATALIEYVMQERTDDKAFFRRALEPITDPELKEAMRARAPAGREDRPLAEIVTQGLFGYRRGTLMRLQEATVEELKEALKTLDGNIDEVLGALLQQGAMATNGQTIRDNVLEALRKLSDETIINKRRPKRWIEDPPTLEQG